MELRQRGINAESLNLAVTGYGSQRNEVLLRKILGYQPSLIILKLDVTNEGADETTAERNRLFLSPWPQDWLWKSYLIQSGLRLKEERLMNRTLPPQVLATTEKRPSQKVARVETASLFNDTSCRAIAECLRLAREQRVPVLLVTQAYVIKSPDGRAIVTDHGLDDFAATLCGPGVTMFSLKQLLENLPVEETFADHVHLTRPTHQRVAQALAATVAGMASVKLPP
jgi:hypothetical protein